MININDLTEARIAESCRRFIDEVLKEGLLPQMRMSNNGEAVEFSPAIYSSTVQQFIDD